MERELYVHMGFYLTMKDGETQEEAENRFHEMMSWLDKAYPEEQDSGYQVYETRIEEM